jgi:hypothetical protein
MSTQGVILLDLIGIGMLLFILNFVRTKRLHVSYAVVWCLAVIMMMVIISVPSLMELLPLLMGAVFPASALSLLAFAFIFVVLIFFSVQLSTLSERQNKLIRSMAIEELLKQQRDEKSGDGQSENLAD